MKLISHLVGPDEFGNALQTNLQDAPKVAFFGLQLPMSQPVA